MSFQCVDMHKYGFKERTLVYVPQGQIYKAGINTSQGSWRGWRYVRTLGQCSKTAFLGEINQVSWASTTQPWPQAAAANIISVVATFALFKAHLGSCHNLSRQKFSKDVVHVFLLEEDPGLSANPSWHIEAAAGARCGPQWGNGLKHPCIFFQAQVERLEADPNLREILMVSQVHWHLSFVYSLLSSIDWPLTLCSYPTRNQFCQTSI